MRRFPFLLVSSLILMLLIAVEPVTFGQADELLAPDEIQGEVVYIPFPVDLTLDGDLSDWASVPFVTVDRGTMTSPDPANNGSFDFAFASDGEQLFLAMTSVDGIIITGQHGDSYWNEDSLEFYVNYSGDLGATLYGDGIFQVNINPGDIGNTDPSALTLTGTGAASSGVQGFVFETGDGWGFEVAMPLPFTPEHGTEIGVQAQANGSNEGDRTVKLIWSNADTSDNSWQNPSLFGRGLFFEVGRTDIPEPSEVVIQEESEVVTEAEQEAQPFVAVNQTGYFPGGVKIAVYPYASPNQRTAFTLIDTATDQSVHAGLLAPGTSDDASGDTVSIVDFTAFDTPGTYTLRVNEAVSVPFTIGGDLYAPLIVDALRYFYLNRSGIELEAQHAGEAYARPAGHVTDNNVTCFSGTDAAGREWPGCDYRLDGSGGWYDAGDFGKYVVNAGISVWTLLDLYERMPDAVPDSALNIPESGDGVPDILDEARWEVDWMLRMQVPDGQPNAGMAHHKLHGLVWDGLPVMPQTDFDVDNPNIGRYLMPPSTAATLNLAAVAAQCARVWREFDPDFADRCLTAAEKAYAAALENPDMLYDGQIPGNGGGGYDDQRMQDEFLWAAAELYITTGKQEYLDVVQNNPDFTDLAAWNPNELGAMWWGGVSTLGLMALADGENIPSDLRETAQSHLLTMAEHYLDVQQREGYRVPMADYVWGSNSTALNNAMVMAYAYDLTGEAHFLDGIVQTMDWILGRNALNHSFVSGYGTNAMQHPHHRVWADTGPFPPVPPGAIAGGVNSFPADAAAQRPEIANQPRAKRYIDHIDSYSTNEVAINWNAPLAWVAAWIDAQF